MTPHLVTKYPELTYCVPFLLPVADVVTSTDDTTARLTDVSGYTGSHKVS